MKKELEKFKKLLKKKIKVNFKKLNFKKMTFKSREVFIFVAIAIVLSTGLGTFIGYKFSKSNNKTGDDSKLMQEFIDNYEYIIENYYGDINEKELLDSAIKGVLNALGDPFSSYIDSGDTNFNIMLDGSFIGVGVELQAGTDGYINVLGVFNDSPAKVAGINVGDKIVSIDGISYFGKQASELSDYIRTYAGPYTLVIKRGEEDKTIIVNKGKVVIPSVSHKVFDIDNKKVGYVSVSIFAANTFEQFETAIKDLEKKGIDSLIIDLRNNSGGHLSVVKNMTSLFLSHEKVVYQTENKDGRARILSSGNKDASYPIVLLGNGSSASASEVMIASLTENLGATFIGEKTYGKGTVQELQNLSGGASYKFTIKKWLTPKGNWVHGKGIIPTLEVKASAEYMENPTEDNDNQLQQALIRLSK